VITGSFVLAGLGAYYLLANQHQDFGRVFVRVGVIVGIIATIFQLYPTGDLEGQQVTTYQPIKLAAMEGLFHTEKGAEIVILGQPDMQKQTLDNPIALPDVLSFLTYRQWRAVVRGLNSFPRVNWPDNVPLTYYVYHIMVGLGTFFIIIMTLATLLLWRRRLFQTRWMLWILMLAAPFPFVANSAGWLTTELGRQPWLVYGLMRTSAGPSPLLSSGNVLFTLIGFAGMYLVLGLLYVVLVVLEALRGPHVEAEGPDHAEALTAY
jgi:cytochrome d ubiquinol oxidase subunit I